MPRSRRLAVVASLIAGAALMPVAQAAVAQGAVASSPRAAPAPMPVKLGQCVACHGVDGRSRIPGTPHLAGQDETYLRNALAAYRGGTRAAVPMNAIANTLQPRDIAALARWYATRPVRAR